MKEKKPYKRFPISVRESAMQRMKLGVNVSELARQLGVDRTTLYWWKRKLEKARARRQGDKAADVMDERDYQIRELESKIAGLEGELGVPKWRSVFSKLPCEESRNHARRNKALAG